MTIAAGALMQGAIAAKGSPAAGKLSAAATTPAAARVWGTKGSLVAQTGLQGGSGVAAGPVSFGLKLQALLQSAADAQNFAQTLPGDGITESAQSAGATLPREQGMLDAMPLRSVRASEAMAENTAAGAVGIEKPQAATAGAQFATRSYAKTSQHAEKPEARAAGSKVAAAAAPVIAPHPTAATVSETSSAPRNFPSQGSSDPLTSIAAASSAPIAAPVVNLPAASGPASAERGAARMPAAGSSADFVSPESNAVTSPLDAGTAAERIAVTHGPVQSAVNLTQNSEGSLPAESMKRAQSTVQGSETLKSSAAAAPVQASTARQTGNLSSVPMPQSEPLSSRPDAGAEAGTARLEDGSRAKAPLDVSPNASPDVSPQSLPQRSPAAQPTPAPASAIDPQLKADADVRFVQAGQADRDPAASEQVAVQAGAPRVESADATAKTGPRQSSAPASSVRAAQAAEHPAPVYGGAEMRTAQMAAPTVDRTADAGHAAEALRGSNNEVFAALDAPGAPATSWIHAGAHNAEAGYLDPALGWVGVRAETTGAAVHATIVPPSADAAQVLGSHLPALSAYMAEHPTAATQVTMAAPEMGTAAQSSNHQMAGDSGNQPSQQNMPGDAADSTGPALRGRTSQSSGAAQFTPPVGLRSGSTISLVA